MIAGDGNAYVPYGYLECNGVIKAGYHLRLLQISSAGTFNELTIADTQPPTMQYDGAIPSVNVIANADTGVLLTWSISFVGGEVPTSTQSGMAITTGTSITAVNPPSVAGQTDIVTPVLQAQDGSFVGSVPVVSGTNMVAFDASGNARWVVLHETLHNVTRLNDDDLYMLLTGHALPGPSAFINTALIGMGCAVN